MVEKLGHEIRRTSSEKRGYEIEVSSRLLANEIFQDADRHRRRRRQRPTAIGVCSIGTLSPSTARMS
jgi:hypothetical protein